MPTVFPPHGWSAPEQWVEFIGYAQEKYGQRVKFLTFREALERLEKNALAGHSLRAREFRVDPLNGKSEANACNGRENGVALLDVDGDGFMDVMIGNNDRDVTRVWQPKQSRWSETGTPELLQTFHLDGRRDDYQIRFGVVRGATVMLGHKAWQWTDGRWESAPELLRGLPDGFSTAAFGTDAGVRLRDFDGAGQCELLANHD